MRQLCLTFLFIMAMTAAAQTAAESSQNNADKKIEQAQREFQKISDLVKAGALPRVRLEQAEMDVADSRDDAILQRTLYGDLPVQNLNEQMAEDMVAAAQRRVERQQLKIQQSQNLVNDGVIALSSLTPLQEELKLRELNLSLAHSRSKLIGELAAIARFEHSMQQVQDATHIDYHDYVTKGMEHFEGSGVFLESRDLKPLQTAFVKKFEYSLPISADGETALHRSMGFDHRGRVDVAVNPSAQEGIWLRRYLKTHGIPYYAFTRAMRGKATAAHIHIGPGSTRLHNAD